MTEEFTVENELEEDTEGIKANSGHAADNVDAESEEEDLGGGEEDIR